MNISIFQPAQTDSLVTLLEELFSYYNPSENISSSLVREHLLTRILSKEAGLNLIVCSGSTGEALGFAAIGFVQSVVDPRPENSKQCFLKELYVSNEQRGSGVGRLIMEWVADYAIKHGCARIDWPVKSGNSGGRRFYESLGAKLVDDRLSYRISGDALAKLADAKLRHRAQIGS